MQETNVIAFEGGVTGGVERELVVTRKGFVSYRRLSGLVYVVAVTRVDAALSFILLRVRDFFVWIVLTQPAKEPSWSTLRIVRQCLLGVAPKTQDGILSSRSFATLDSLDIKVTQCGVVAQVRRLNSVPVGGCSGHASSASSNGRTA